MNKKRGIIVIVLGALVALFLIWDIQRAGPLDRLKTKTNEVQGPAWGSSFFQGAEVISGQWLKDISLSPSWGGGQDLALLVHLSLNKSETQKLPEVRAELEAFLESHPQSLFARNVGDVLKPALMEAAGKQGWNVKSLQVSLPPRELVQGALQNLSAVQPKPTGKVIWLGLDGADWRIVDPLLAAGKMPNLARLKRTGTYGHLVSHHPMLSPLLWTTMVTGKTPDQHGILDFLALDAETSSPVPISSTFRQVPAAWNIASEAGLSSAWIGLWASYPAEKIKGKMITDRVAFSLYRIDTSPDPRGLTWPPQLAEKVMKTKVDPGEVDPELWARLLPLGPLPEDENRASGGMHFESPVDHLRQVVAATETYFQLAEQVLASDEEPFVALYVEGTDEVAHRFMHTTKPKLPWVSDQAVKHYAQVLEVYYQWVDRRIGQLMNLAGADATFLVVSDHGFKSGAERPTTDPGDFQKTAADWHHRLGLYLLSGPGVPIGDGGAADLNQVFPSLMALQGLPVPAGQKPLPGIKFSRVKGFAGFDLLEAYRERPQQVARSSEENQAMIEKLMALGYVSGGDLAPASQINENVEGFRRTGLAAYNRGVVLYSRGSWDEATEAFTEARQQFGLDPLTAYFLGELARRRNLPNEAVRFYREVLASEARAVPQIYFPLIRSLLDADRKQEVLDLLKSPPRVEGKPLEEIRLAGLAYLAEQEGAFNEAELQYRKALALDPTLGTALAGLFRVYRTQETPQSMIPWLDSALEQDPSPQLMVLMGRLQLDLEKANLARSWFENALELRPDSTPARVGLAQERIAAHDAGGAGYHLQQALAQSPFDGDVLRTAAALELLRGNDEQAQAQYEILVKANPKDPALLYPLAVLVLRKGDQQRAKELLQTAVQWEYLDGPSHQLLALLKNEKPQP